MGDRRTELLGLEKEEQMRLADREIAQGGRGLPQWQRLQPAHQQPGPPVILRPKQPQFGAGIGNPARMDRERSEIIEAQINAALAPGLDQEERLAKLPTELIDYGLRWTLRSGRGPNLEFNLLLAELSRRRKLKEEKRLEALEIEYKGAVGHAPPAGQRVPILEAVDYMKPDNLATSSRISNIYNPLFPHVPFEEANKILGEGGKYRSKREFSYIDDLAMEAHYGKKVPRKIVPGAASGFISGYLKDNIDPLAVKMFMLGDKEMRGYFGPDWDVPDAQKALSIVDIGEKWRGAMPEFQFDELRKLPLKAQEAAARMEKKLRPAIAKEFEQLMKKAGKP